MNQYLKLLGIFLLGRILGAWLVDSFMTKLLQEFVATTKKIEDNKAQNRFIARYYVLNELRQGNTQQAETKLNQQQDMDLISFAAMVQQGSLIGNRTNLAINAEIAAREQSAYLPNDPKLRTQVQSAIEMLKHTSPAP